MKYFDIILRWKTALLLTVLWLAMAERALADAIDPFVGEFIGRSVGESGSEIDARDASVTIEQADDGFVIMWTTVTRRADGSVKRKSHSVRFQSTQRLGIFSSAMKRDKFGALAPLDPLRGDPYVWAKIEGKVLTVYAMIITDTGGYEMQTYDRTLTETGLDLQFSRVADGQILKSIQAKLTRTKK